MLTPTSGDATNQAAIDTAMIEHCIRLSVTAAQQGEYPFAALICKGGEIVVETTNQAVQNEDVTRHAELMAVLQAQNILGRKDQSDCSLYCNIEPCAMCSFPIRETRIARVVFAISSPMMGGFSKWNILRDTELSHAMPEAFGPVPEVVAGLLAREAERVWWKWNPLIWAVIKHRGCFSRHVSTSKGGHAAPRRGLLSRFWMMLNKRRSV